ncbi:MAG: adenylate/guanylate cyclase domain-containing protein [Spirochaetes bacterium]|nr:adenylate/guanylate cyclase domain-containing protein [Spirochaetota bacterium]
MAETRRNLKQYLETNPWQERWRSLGVPVEYYFTYELPVSAHDLWPLVSDTSLVNKKLGLTGMDLSERNGRLHGKTRFGVFRVEWEEPPWGWESGKELRVERIYSKGFAHYVRFHLLLEDDGDSSCRVLLYFGWIPRNLAYRTLLLAARSRYRRRYGEVLAELASAAVKPVDFRLLPAESLRVNERSARSDVNTSRIAAIHARLIEDRIDAEYVERLIRYIETAPDDDLYRMRPKRIAESTGADWLRLLSVMLHATRRGMLNLTWDVICPHCRGVRARTDHLWDVPETAACEVCAITFTTGAVNAIEITFRINPEIKRVEPVLYCSAEPARKPHIRLQRELVPDERRAAAVDYGEGRYRLRILGSEAFNFLDIDGDYPPREILWEHSAENMTFQTGPGATLLMVNGDSVHHIFIVEESGEDAESLRPGDLFNFQEFRDLFSREALAAGLSIDVGVQNILFVDIVKSTELYGREGNSRAFSMVREFFEKSHAIAMAHRGVIVKTIGDAALLSFSDPLDTLRGAIEFMSLFDGRDPAAPIRTRASINRGPCLAVNLNSAIDYFGQPVNVAAKLQAYADAGEIAVAENFMREPSVSSYLAGKGFNFEREKTAYVRGAGSVTYWVIRPRFRGRN